MKKTFLLIAFFALTAVAVAQTQPEMKYNETTNLVEATYFFENGAVSQEGTFNLKKQLHGEWISYNEDGQTISVGSYQNGVKSGKWLFWNNDVLKEVEYNNNVIAAVNETKNSEGIVSRN